MFGDAGSFNTSSTASTPSMEKCSARGCNHMQKETAEGGRAAAPRTGARPDRVFFQTIISGPQALRTILGRGICSNSRSAARAIHGAHLIQKPRRNAAELQRHEEVEEEEDQTTTHDNDDDRPTDLEEMDDLDDQFENGGADDEDLMPAHSLGGNQKCPAGLQMGSEKTNGGLQCISDRCKQRRPLADSTNAQSVIFPSENGFGRGR